MNLHVDDEKTASPTTYIIV